MNSLHTIKACLVHMMAKTWRPRTYAFIGQLWVHMRVRSDG